MRIQKLSVSHGVVAERLEERAFLSVSPSGISKNVPNASAGFQVVYDLNIPKLGGNFSANGVPYSVNNSANTPAFDRVAYYLELTKPGGAVQWVFASMDSFTADAKKLGVPTAASGAFFQQKVTNLTVWSNVSGVTTGSKLSGNLEFWPNSYDPPNSANVPGASGAIYDFGDKPFGPSSTGWGSMQLHNTGAKQTIFAYNDWGGLHPNENAELGIGKSPTGAPDWTGNNSAGQWTVRRLQVLVHPSKPTISLGTILPLGDSITWGYTPNVTPTGGYRSRLYTDLSNAGKSFTYAGSVKDTYYGPLIAAHEDLHEGHGGFRTDQILGNLTDVAAGTNVSSNNGGHWLDGTSSHPAVFPNIILLHIGTNDFLQGRAPANAANVLDQIVDKLTTLRPNAKLFVSNIVPIANSASQNASVKAYNNLIPGIVQKYKNLGKKVFFVDQYKNFVDANGKITGISSDGVHPTRAGYDKIGDTWFNAIKANA